MYLIFDTETTGLPKNFNAPITDHENWPRCIQLAWQLHDGNGKLINQGNLIVKPEGFTIPFNATKIHGISTEKALAEGHDLSEVLRQFNEALDKAEFLVGHNIGFDINIMACELDRLGINSQLLEKSWIDTKSEESATFCALSGGRGGKYKWPTLTELYTKLFGTAFDSAHNAAFDVHATAKAFFELLKRKIIPNPGLGNSNSIQYEAPDLDLPAEDTTKSSVNHKAALNTEVESTNKPFYHVHVHTQFSILQSTSSIKALLKKAKEDGMPAVAITDHGNMYGAFSFVQHAIEMGITPIVGSEFNLCSDHLNKSLKDNGANQVLLAKNKNGYHNLVKLSSISITDGFYYVPRIDKQLIETYKQDLIAITGGLYGEIPNLILNVGETQAEEAFQWWHNTFGDDFYVEINRHGLEEEKHVNKVLSKLAEKYGVRQIAANNTYYTNQNEAKTQDVLQCVRDGEQLEKPSKYMGARGREYRYGLPNHEFYFKTRGEMVSLFKDTPECIDNLSHLLEKIETFPLQREVLLPKFEIPEGFENEDAYLRHLSFEGAKKKLGEINDVIEERLNFELETIANTGYPGYFLIVQDFTAKARELGVWVGPGRGSAAGSLVAYCTGITNVDPIKYDLLFERFLNPDRISLPDIDIDFDDEGREKIIQYVLDKYGHDQVAQIVTYGKMAGKSAIRDASRVLNLPLADADRLAKLVPVNVSLHDIFHGDEAELKGKIRSEHFQNVEELKKYGAEDNLIGETLKQATLAEGAVRNIGIHACGVIITPEDITNLVPVGTAKDSDLRVTQFDNSVVEDAGLLKMDFLGLKTLSILKDAMKLVKYRHGVDLNPDEIPLDDTTTFELFQRGETTGVFQFESAGMQKYLKELKPTSLEDLIAMNALYRPGPMEYIPSFINRKHGIEKIEYDIEEMKEYLEETYGITVYQEQVMRLSQSLGGFTRGEADTLRKAMGKKKKAELDKMKEKFEAGCEERGHKAEVVQKIWSDWEAFAQYAFNKSHSTCYSIIAYQTGYMKANYPAEYMASVLTHNMSSIEKITFFIEECQKMGLRVLGPDINESLFGFSVNKKGELRFGLGGIKGVGEKAIENIIEERTENGAFQDIFDLTKRVNLRAVNKRCLESLVNAGGFDTFENTHRAQYFACESNDSLSTLEKAIKFGADHQNNADASQGSLFGEAAMNALTQPSLPESEPWSLGEQLRREKEVAGFYLSGHPLDPYKLEINSFVNSNTIKAQQSSVGSNITIAGIISDVVIRKDKKDQSFAFFQIEDFEGTIRLGLFRELFLKFQHFMKNGLLVCVTMDYAPKWHGSDQYDLRIREMELLSELREKKTKGVHLSIDLEDINDDLVASLLQITKEHPGQTPWQLVVHDSKDKVDLTMNGNAARIAVNDKFLDSIQSINKLKFNLN